VITNFRSTTLDDSSLPNGLYISEDYAAWIIQQSGYYYDAMESCGGAAEEVFKQQWKPRLPFSLTSAEFPATGRSNK